MTATAMQHPAGRWAVGIAGLIIVICGLVLVVEGARKKFMKYLRTAQMSARMRRVVKVLGMTGTIARGLVFALAGALVIDAAVTHKASESGGGRSEPSGCREPGPVGSDLRPARSWPGRRVPLRQGHAGKEVQDPVRPEGPLRARWRRAPG
jgi:hypothetical protein